MIVNLEDLPIVDFPTNNINLYTIKRSNQSRNAVGYSYVLQDSEYCQHYDVYVVGVLNFTSFFNHVRFDEYIPNDIILKIRNKQLILAIDASGDAFHKLVENLYKKIINENIPSSQVLLVSCSPNLLDSIFKYATEHNIEPIKYECYYFWENLVRHSLSTELNAHYGKVDPVVPNIKSPLTKESHPKVYLSLTRLWREHKGMLLMLLKHKGLLNQGHVSFSQMAGWDSFTTKIKKYFDNEYLHSVIDSQYDIGNSLPLKLDTHNFQSYDLTYFSRGLIKFYNESLLSLVLETHYENRYPFHCSEKIFKAIFHKHPFIVVSTPYFLQNLKNMGYKTFGEIINEDYDVELDPNERIIKIVNEIERISKFSPSDLTEFKTKALDIVEHNFHTLMTKTKFVFKLN